VVTGCLPFAKPFSNSITYARGLTVAEKIFCESGRAGKLQEITARIFMRLKFTISAFQIL
jgi:hypothetical protein